MAGIGSINTPHGFEIIKNDIKLNIFMYLDKLFYRYFDYVVPLSKELHTIIVKYKVNPKKIRLIFNGIDLEDIDKERNKNIRLMIPNKGRGGIIGYIGQLITRKNIYDILKVFELLMCQQNNKNIKLVIIGDGAERYFLENYAKSLQANASIYFLGYRSDRLRLLRGMDIFTMTSMREGIPRCMMEAMAMGIPVAAYNVPGVNKLIINNRTGLTTDYGDIEALARCWKRLLYNDELSRNLAENAKKYIMNNFSAKNMADQYTDLYQKLVVRG